MDKIVRARKTVSLYAAVGLGLTFNRKTPEQVYMDVLRVIAERYGLTLKQILGVDRYAEIVHARKVFVYWMRSRYGKDAPYAALGDWLYTKPRMSKRGFREVPDHAAVMHAYKVYDNSIKSKTPVAMPKRIKHIAASVQDDWQVVSKLLDLSCT